MAENLNKCVCGSAPKDIHDNLMGQITSLAEQLRDQRCPVDVRGAIRECIASGQCGCTNGLILAIHKQTGERE